MIVCHFLWYTLIGILPTAIAAISTLAIPISGVYSNSLLLGEQVGTRECISLNLVVLALAIVLAPPPFWRRFHL
jgi:drug/metabolite transporter (DMT)-like permease